MFIYRFRLNEFFQMNAVALFTCVLAASWSFSARAEDYYVNPDPTLASDDYDGTRAVLEAGTKHGPKQTLKGAMEITGLGAGDIVHAARGVYNEGVMAPVNIKNETTSNRVVVVTGVGLVADEGAAVTAIEGYIPPTTSTSISTNGGPTSVRCVAFASTDKEGYVKGFTLRNGSTAIGSGTGNKISLCRGGGIYYGTAIDCVITNCYAVRGGGAAHATLIRSRIEACNVVRGKNAQGGAAGVGSTASIYCSCYDSYLSGSSQFLYGAVNCQFEGDTSGDSGNIGTVNNCYFSASPSDLTQVNCVIGGGLELDALSRPTQATIIGKGSVAAYVYPTEFASEAGKDLLGRPRLADGKIDIGCYERVSMTFYVDANNGNDDWDGSVATNATPATSLQGPRKTLAAVMAIAGLGSGDTVRALPGTYSEGLVWDSSSNASNRVIVASGVGLVSVNGPLETIIEGKMATDTESGLWADAVRGVSLRSKSYVKGFTIQNGSTPANVNGSAILLGANTAAIDCRIVKNKVGPAGRSAAYCSDTSGVLIRCFLNGNSAASDSTGVGASCDCCFNCVASGSGGIIYAANEGCAVNCTFVNGATCLGSKSRYINSYNNLWIGLTPSKNFYWSCLIYDDGVKISYDESGACIEEIKAEAPTLDASYRPPARCAAIDAGTLSNYTENFPALWSEFANYDYAGGQRVCNDKIDIGAGERVRLGMSILFR